jgi:hypothetical protein
VELFQDPPPGFEAIIKAFAMARQLPATHRLNVRIGLAHEGALLARDVLDGYRQVTLLCEQLHELGWHERLRDTGEDLLGCDMLFSHAAAGRDDEDPSFIRRTAVQLWPAEGEPGELGTGPADAVGLPGA